MGVGRLGAYFPKFCNIVNRNGSRVETTNDPTDRIVFVSSGSQMVKITRILKYRLEISPKVGFNVANFFDTQFSNFFCQKSQINRG